MNFTIEQLAGNELLCRLLALTCVTRDGCWIWMGSKNNGGYGKIGRPRSGNRGVSVHRASYELLVGPIPAGYQIDHLCKNTSCLNPAHLEAVTPRENVLRGNTFARHQAAQTHCVKGHPLSGDNLYRHPDGSRKCRACRRSYESDRYMRRRALKPVA
jgi:hypothetical protein